MNDINLVKKRRNAKSHQAIFKAKVNLLDPNSYVDFSIEKVSEMQGRSAETDWTKGGCTSWYITKQGVNKNN